MSLNDAETLWIETTAGAVPTMDAALSREQRKQRMLTTARAAIEGQVGEIKLGNDFKIEMLSDFFKFKYEMATVTGDANTEFDIDNDLKSVNSVDPRQIKLLTDAQTIVFNESETLRRAKDEQTGKPLFTDREISDAIWEPLKRRKLVPEAAVPDRYSEVARGFDAASGDYGERLEAYDAKLGDQSKWAEGLGVAQDVFSTAGTLVSGVIGDLKALNFEKIGDMSPSQVSDILKGVTVGTSGLIDVTKALVQNDGKLDAAVIEQVCKNVITVAQAEIKAGLTTQSDSSQSLGGAISAGIGLVINGAAITRMLAKKEASFTEIAKNLGEAIEGCFSVYASQIDYHEKKEKEEKGEKDSTSAGSAATKFELIGKGVNGAIQSFNGFQPFLKKPSRETLTDALLGMVEAGVKTAGNELATLGKINSGKDVDWGKFENSVAAVNDTLGKLRAADKAGREKMLKEDPGIKALIEHVEKEEAAATGGLTAEKWQDDLAEDTRGFRDMLNRSETGEDEDDIEKVEALTAQIQKDQMMVNLAFQIVSIGPKAIAAFLPAAGIAVSGVSLVQNLIKAREHFIAFGEWKENTSDARSAMSFQMEAMLNRKNNSRNQSADAVVKAITDAMQIVCQSVACAGPFAPAGKIAGSVVSSVAAIKDLIQKQVAKRDLEKAYQAYQTARQNPDNRKTLREAVRKNATLAKYLIAWGALVDNNPVAKRAMEKCGLTAEMLTNKNTNAQNAVAYLESLYPEDPVVMHRAENPKAWYPGAVAFTAVSFAAFASAAERIAEPKLAPNSCRALIELFSRWEKLNDDLKAARGEWDKALQAAEVEGATEEVLKEEKAALLTLQAKLDLAEQAALALVRRLPVEKMLTAERAPKPHAEMKEYIRLLIPLGLGFTKQHRRDAEALERQEGALQRNPNSGRVGG